MKNQAELHIPVKEPEFEATMIISPPDKLQFAREHNAETSCLPIYTDGEDDDQIVKAVLPVDSWDALIADCAQGMKRIDAMAAEQEQLRQMEARVDNLTERVERVLDGTPKNRPAERLIEHFAAGNFDVSIEDLK